MKHTSSIAFTLASLLLAFSGWSVAQTPASPNVSPTAKLSNHVKKDIERHRAMALAHEGAARCLESGKSETDCQKELQAACKGLAIGKYCGMRHEH